MNDWTHAQQAPMRHTRHTNRRPHLWGCWETQIKPEGNPRQHPRFSAMGLSLSSQGKHSKTEHSPQAQLDAQGRVEPVDCGGDRK